MESGDDPANLGEQGLDSSFDNGSFHIDGIKRRSSILASAILGTLITFGIFNRITFPAFLLVPGLYLLPHFLRKYVTL